MFEIMRVNCMFSYFSQNTGFDISYKLSSMGTICVKCQNLFSGKKKKKNYFKMSSAETLPRVLNEMMKG